MDTTLLKQFGAAATASAALVAVAGESLPTALVNTIGPHQGVLFVAGALAFGVGLLVDRASARRCQRCARKAIGSSVFCAIHRQQLETEAGLARTRKRSDNRIY